jgi:AcrR family transcriptional regulator
MPRSGAEARRRLQQAALELYGDHGFEATTAAQIAERAGVNERTFFRHFRDKREVLFDGEDELHEAVRQAVADAPKRLKPFGIALSAFRVCAQQLEERSAFSAPRRKIIAATPALRERDAAKHAGLTEAVREALQSRGIDDSTADLVARTGWAAYQHAVAAWIEKPGQGLDAHVVQAFAQLRALSGGIPPTGA